MEAGDTNPAVVGNGCGYAIELSAKKRGAGSNVECIVEENVVLRPILPCRTGFPRHCR